MSDVVVTVPKRFEYDGFRGLTAWAAEGCLPGAPATDRLYQFITYGTRPDISIGERVYIVCEDRVRGFAPLVGLTFEPRVSRHHGLLKVGRIYFYRGGDAQAVTIPEKVRGFRGWKYRWWPLEREVPFPDWLPADKRALLVEACYLERP